MCLDFEDWKTANNAYVDEDEQADTMTDEEQALYESWIERQAAAAELRAEAEEDF